MDYYNAIIDRITGAQIMISLDDLYLITIPLKTVSDTAVQYVACNKYTDRQWFVDSDTYAQLETAMIESKKK